jgi:HK97 family phage major capsid protein
VHQSLLNQLLTLRDNEESRRQACIDTAKELGYRRWSDDKTGELRKMFKASDATLRALDARIAETRSEIQRSGGDNPFVQAIKAGGGGERSAAIEADAWARRVATRLAARNAENRAISSGSLDIPNLVPPYVSALPWPKRLIDLLVNRMVATSNVIEFFQQTVKTNNAAPVADLAEKPTSTFTLTPVQDRCRVIAHLSEPVPVRYLQDVEQVQPFLAREMAQGILAALEHQVISGDGTGENMTGLLNLAGTTAVPYQGDPLTTIRHSLTQLQNLGEEPTGIALNPVTAEEIDLTRWGSQGGLLTSGFDHPNNVGYGSSTNFFGDDSQVKRVISPSVPAGTAIIGDWSQVVLYVRESMSLVLNYWSDALFSTNAFILRCEMRTVAGFLRPQAFAVATITGT